VGGARRAVEHLVAAGHTRIAFLGDRLDVFTAQERQAGYRRALGGRPVIERTELFSSELGYAATLDVMQSDDPPTALFTGQNLITIGAIRALRSLGLQREIALVGFDDITLGDLVDPGITVVAQDPYALGRHAGELLFRRLRGEASDPTTVVVPTRLIARGSGEIRPPHAQPARARSRR